MFEYRVRCVLILVIVLLVGCTPGNVTGITGSGNSVTREKDFSGFDQVDASAAFQVDIRQGERFSVVIRIDDNLEQYLEVTKQGGTLKIGLESGHTYRSATLEAEVTMPELTGVEASGTSHVTITGFESTKGFAVDLSGASSLHGDIEAGDVRLDVSGASEVTLSGSGQDLTVDVSGASTVDLANFSVEDADVEASGDSEATVNPSGTLDANASGASQVYYLGSPTMGAIETSGASSVGRR